MKLPLALLLALMTAGCGEPKRDVVDRYWYDAAVRDARRASVLALQWEQCAERYKDNATKCYNHATNAYAGWEGCIHESATNWQDGWDQGVRFGKMMQDCPVVTNVVTVTQVVEKVGPYQFEVTTNGSSITRGYKVRGIDGNWTNAYIVELHDSTAASFDST